MEVSHVSEKQVSITLCDFSIEIDCKSTNYFPIRKFFSQNNMVTHYGIE